MIDKNLDNIFESDDFTTCENKLKNALKSYWDSDESKPKIQEDSKSMKKLKSDEFGETKIEKFFKDNYFSDEDKWTDFLNTFNFKPRKDKFFYNIKDPQTFTQNIFSFYNKHPFLTPFVGQNYGTVLNKPIKVLYVLESHYLPTYSKVYKKYTEKENQQQWLLEEWYASDWNNVTEKGCYREDIEYMWTESVIKYNMVNSKDFIHMLKRMLLPLYDAIKEFNGKTGQVDDAFIGESIDEKINDIVQSIAFMNYYLRPSENTARHINPKEIDNFFSFLNLLVVWEKLEKPKVVICSTRAGNSFKSYSEHMKDEYKNLLPNEFIICNHPDNRSWNNKKTSSHETQKAFWNKILTNKK